MYIVCLAARVIKKISTGFDRVVGVTLVNDELFVLLERDVDQVAVYSINDYRRLRHLTMFEYRPDNHSDISSTSCKPYSLYMSDFGNSCIRRYNLASFVPSKWPVRGRPRGLSITPSGNLLVAVEDGFHDGKLVEMRSDSGECVSEVALQSDIQWPRHAVQLAIGKFVVCHGVIGRFNSRVCVVGDDGKLERSYGGQEGSDVGQLRWPSHLAVDKDSQFIFVADTGNDRVVLLSPTLELVRYVSEGLPPRPQRLHFHPSTRRLFVGHSSHQGHGVAVIQF